jgi:hypothetical protein
MARAGVTIDNKEISRLFDNLTTTYNMISVKAARILSLIAVDLLSKAQPRVPYDTGELRRSGKARLVLGNSEYVVGSGNEDGTVTANLAKLSWDRVSNSTRITANVHYERFNADGEDIALWTHEELNPYTSAVHPRARFPGTGPKYLENPWLENKGTYIKMIQEDFSTLSNDLAKIAKKRSTKGMGKFTVSTVELDKSKI